MVKHGLRSPRPRPTRPRRPKLNVIGKRTPERLRRQPSTERLGLLLRLLLPLVDAAAGLRRRRVRAGATGSRAAATPSSPRSTSSAQAAAQAERRASRSRCGNSRRADGGRGRAGHRPVQAMATNRNFSNDQSTNGTEHRTRRKGRRDPGQLPEHHQPADQRRRRHHRLPGRLDVQDLHHGRRAGAGAAAGLRPSPRWPSTSPVDYPRRAGHARRLPGTNHYCPTNARQHEAGPYNMWTGFGQLGQHLLRAAAGAGRRRERRRGREAAGHPASAPAGRRDHRRPRAPTAVRDRLGRRSPSASPRPRPLDLANAYATLAADGMYCEPIPVIEILDLNGNKLDVAKPRCKQAVDTEVARAAVDAARCPVGDQSDVPASAPARTAGNGARRRRASPVAGKTGTTDSNKTATLVAMTKQLAVAGDPRRPGLAETSQQMTPHNDVNPAVCAHHAGRSWPASRRSSSPRPSAKIASTVTSGQHPDGDLPVASDEAQSGCSSAGLRGRRSSSEPGRLGLPGRHRGRHRPRAADRQGRLVSADRSATARAGTGRPARPRRRTAGTGGNGGRGDTR